MNIHMYPSCPVQYFNIFFYFVISCLFLLVRRDNYAYSPKSSEMFNILQQHVHGVQCIFKGALI